MLYGMEYAHTGAAHYAPVRVDEECKNWPMTFRVQCVSVSMQNLLQRDLYAAGTSPDIFC